MKKILVTGGAGYIGSHTVVELFNSGFTPIIIDNLCNSSQESITRVESIADKCCIFYEGDVLNKSFLEIDLLELEFIKSTAEVLNVFKEPLNRELRNLLKLFSEIFNLCKSFIEIPSVFKSQAPDFILEDL